MDKYSCDYTSFEVLNYIIQISDDNLATALRKLSEIHCFVLSPMLVLLSYQGSFNRGKFVVK